MNKIDEKILLLEKEIVYFYNGCIKNGVTLLTSVAVVFFSLNFFLYRRSSAALMILFFLLSSIQMQKTTSNYKSKNKNLGKITSLIHSFLLISCVAFFPKINLMILWLFIVPAMLVIFFPFKKMFYFSSFFWITFFILKELFRIIHFQAYYFTAKPYSQHSLEHYVNTVFHFIMSIVFLFYFLSEIKKREYLVNFLKEKQKLFHYLENVDEFQILFNKIDEYIKKTKNIFCLIII